uniref:Major facilitator superfamily (MFS) profile domain-containing protein n=1 Tax=Oryza nivara TaxID=4536 RepID=A0A0E0I786_ORYNI
MPAYLLTALLLDRFGRKPLAIGMMLLSGISCSAGNLIAGAGDMRVARLACGVCLGDIEYQSSKQESVERGEGHLMPSDFRRRHHTQTPSAAAASSAATTSRKLSYPDRLYRNLLPQEAVPRRLPPLQAPFAAASLIRLLIGTSEEMATGLRGRGEAAVAGTERRQCKDS